MCSESSNSCSAFKYAFIGFIAGAVAGAVTTLLLTPRTGKEMRAEIKKAIVEISENTEEQAKKIKNITKEKYTELVNNVIENYKKARDFTQREIEIIKKVILEKKDIEAQ